MCMCTKTISTRFPCGVNRVAVTASLTRKTVLPPSGYEMNVQESNYYNSLDNQHFEMHFGCKTSERKRKTF